MPSGDESRSRRQRHVTDVQCETAEAVTDCFETRLNVGCDVHLHYVSQLSTQAARQGPQ
jgi:hypothetical protein